LLRRPEVLISSFFVRYSIFKSQTVDIRSPLKSAFWRIITVANWQTVSQLIMMGRLPTGRGFDSPHPTSTFEIRYGT
jgi:hypothetical protein